MALITFDEMAVGEQFEPLEYELTPEIVRTFRTVVGDHNPLYDQPRQDGPQLVPPLIFAFDWHTVRNRHGNTQGGLHAKQTFHFPNPARVGMRVRMEAWLADKYERRGYRYTVVSGRIRDSQGTVVAEGSSTVARIEQRFDPQPPRIRLEPERLPHAGPDGPPPLSRRLVEESMAAYWHLVCGRPEEGSHSSVSLARQQGLPSAVGQGNMVLCYLGLMLGEYFGESWLHGGGFEVAIVGRMLEGDTITWHAGRNPELRQASTGANALDVSCVNQRGEVTVVGSARGASEGGVTS